jgi:hypothetical protein
MLGDVEYYKYRNNNNICNYHKIRFYENKRVGERGKKTRWSESL